MIYAKLGKEPYRVDIEANDHVLVSDESTEHGGKNVGPAPFDLVLAGLASCTLITLRMYAERKGWAGVAIAGEFFHRVDEGRHLIDRRVQVSGVPDEGLERMRDIVERTPVTLALKNGFSITTTVHAVAEVR
ncbi:MAG TPA: OsmC family protein [Caulobacteraceae bacterium]|nr:OsmC family protein [Caulobacteraceae bacterium]